MSISKLKPVDIVIVGMGVAGSIVCKELAETGLKVLSLERGRPITPEHDFAMPYVYDELKYDRNSDIIQNLSRETITFRNSMNETALPMREVGSIKVGECVGGAGMHWGGTTFRFLPWDFETHSRTLARYGKGQVPEDCTSQDWGINYDELEPYYDRFDYVYGVAGKAGNLNGQLHAGGNPFEGARSREFPNPPSPPTYAGSLFGKAAESFGYKTFPAPSCTMPRSYVNSYGLTLGKCVRGGFCTNHGCATNAKATPLTTVLPALMKHRNFELRPFANVTKINLDAQRKHAVGVTYIDARGHEVEQPAELVILTSFAFNNTRLMLLSGVGQPYDPIANRGVVGRNYSFQTNSSVRLFFEDRVFNRFIGSGPHSIAIDEFNGDNFDHSGLDFIGGAFLAAHVGGLPIRLNSVPPNTPQWGAAWKKAIAQYYDRSFQIAVGGACQSYRFHYLDLDPTYRDAFGLPLVRMTFDWHANEKNMSRHITDKAAEIAKTLSPSKISVNPVGGKFSIVASGSTHVTGGVVMGASPATSAVNKYLQSWDVPNVFVIGASAFPQNSAYGPTATVGALAYWAADAIKQRYLKNPAAL